MSLRFLRVLDRWLGGIFLFLFVWPARAFGKIVPRRHRSSPRFVFLKLKGGGSLIVAMPALLGLRKQHPDAEFVLVCAREARIYAELTGVFSRYAVIDDGNPVKLAMSGLRTLCSVFAANVLVDLEPNSVLAALFTALSCAERRIGLVKRKSGSRRYAYTDTIAFEVSASIHVYYDRICALLGALPASALTCREVMIHKLPPPLSLGAGKHSLIAIAPFTSSFARERMMPSATWAAVLKAEFNDRAVSVFIFGASHNRDQATHLARVLRDTLPALDVTDLSGAGTLAEAAATMRACHEVWAVDSGLLHIARLLGIPTRSFWGPTMPSQRLRPIEHLRERAVYRPFLCSPCIDKASPPCGGYNLCMISMADPTPDLHPPWASNHG